MKSPFKFLDAYTQQDQHLFFGRDDEVEELFHKVFKSNLLLVYGASGTGKTSLILCGLSTKFSDENWYSVYIRRQGDINKSLFAAIDQHTPNTIGPEDLDPSQPEIVQRLENLYLEHFKPIYLIFDQLEELFILGSAGEQAQFYEIIKLLADSKLSCTIILIIREEYFAYLSDMENVVPMLFENRARIEPMRTKKVKEVIDKSCAAHPSIIVQDKENFLEQVVDNLSEDDLTVKLTYLQVYLDKLYKNAGMEGGRHIFDPALIGRTGKVDDVLAQFLEDQVQQLKNPELGWRILKGFISKDGTKKSAGTGEIMVMLKGKSQQVEKTVVEEYLDHFLNSKILTQLENTPEYFEFTHDSLAAKTFEKLDAKERNLFDIQNLIVHQYNGYVTRGILLSRENMLYITPYLRDLNLTKEHENFIKKSRKELNRRRKRRIGGIIGIIMALSVLSFFSLFKWLEANEAKEVAVVQSEVAKKAQQKADSEKSRAEHSEQEAIEAQEKAEYNLIFAKEKKSEAELQKGIADRALMDLGLEKRKTERNLQLKLEIEKSNNLANKSEENLGINPNTALSDAAEAYKLHPSKASVKALMKAFYQPLVINKTKFRAIVTQIAHNSKKNSYFIGLSNGNVLLCDNELKNRKTILGHKGSIVDIEISPLGDRVYTCSTDRTIKVWDENGNFINSRNDVFSPAIKITVLTDGNIIGAFDNGRIIAYDKDLKSTKYTVQEPGLLGIKDIAITENDKLIVLDQNERIWLFDERGQLVNTILQSRIKSIALRQNELYFIAETGLIEKFEVSKLFGSSLNDLKGQENHNLLQNAKQLDLLDEEKLTIYHDRGYITIFNPDSNKGDFLYSPEPSIVATYGPSGNFVICTPDSVVNIYSSKHFDLPRFTAGSYLIEDEGILTDENYTLEKHSGYFILKNSLSRDSTFTFPYSVQHNPISSSSGSEDVYQDPFEGLILEGAIFKGSNLSNFGNTISDVEVEVSLKDMDNASIYTYEKISDVKSISNILISDGNKLALVFTTRQSGIQQVDVFPLPGYIQDISNKKL